MRSAEPFFCVVLHRGDGKWVIEAEWPDGSIEPVDTFSDYCDALNWIRNQAGAWTERRIPAMPQVAEKQN